jgi:mitogen-activated protein kinase 15|tara:strand:+ start:51 stop:1295 length:1245 start_codon:yes stop_codon:yes gene_type:complete
MASTNFTAALQGEPSLKHIKRSLVKNEDRHTRAEMGDSRTTQINPLENIAEEEKVPEAILRKYEFCQKLSYGAYGVVWKVRDKSSRKFVALKKMYQCFRNAEDAQLTYRELMYLHEFKGHDNIVLLKDLIGDKSSNDIWCAFQYMGADLRAVIAADVLSDTHRKYVIYQILRGLKALHTAEVIHRDIKPSNILMDQNCNVRICDLASCRSLRETHVEGVNRDILTQYIGTRWYRAPECILGSQVYGKPVDLWGVGCVLAEMLSNGRPVFPGKSTLDQLRCIIQVTGRPTVEDIRSTGSPVAEIIMADVVQPEPLALSELYPEASAESLDMVRMMLQFNPNRRVLVQQALRHPFVADFHNPDDEPNHYRIAALPMTDSHRHSSDYSRKATWTDLKNYHVQKLEREYHMEVSFQDA